MDIVAQTKELLDAGNVIVLDGGYLVMAPETLIQAVQGATLEAFGDTLMEQATDIESEVDSIGITKISYPRYSRYDEYLDDNGNKIYHDKKTGKDYTSVVYEVEGPAGSEVFIRHPAQLEAIDRKKQQEIERVRNRDLNFYFVLSKDRRGTLEPHTIARLFYLATFLHPNDNILRYDDGTEIKRAEMAKLMGFSDGTLDNFLREVSNRYVFRQPDGTMAISPDFFRGQIADRIKEGANNGHQRVFIKSLRELYRQTPTSKHRYLGYLFLLLPFVNWEYNVLCWNPDEKDVDKINPMSLSDFCEAIGYDDNEGRNSGKLLSAYKRLTFKMRGKEMDVCAYMQNLVTGQKYFVVNPYVIYRGHDRRKVEAFRTLFPSKTRKEKQLKNSQ